MTFINNYSGKLFIFLDFKLLLKSANDHNFCTNISLKIFKKGRSRQLLFEHRLTLIITKQLKRLTNEQICRASCWSNMLIQIVDNFQLSITVFLWVD